MAHEGLELFYSIVISCSYDILYYIILHQIILYHIILHGLVGSLPPTDLGSFCSTVRHRRKLEAPTGCLMGLSRGFRVFWIEGQPL